MLHARPAPTRIPCGHTHAVMAEAPVCSVVRPPEHGVHAAPALAEKKPMGHGTHARSAAVALAPAPANDAV